MRRLILLSFALMTTVSSFAQHDELRQRINAFVEEHAETYEKKFLNISKPDIGDIENTNHVFADRFMLKGREKVTDNLDRSVYPRYYVNVYGYEDESNRDYAMKHWLKNFIEGVSIRPGRDKRIYEYAKPTIVIINSDNIVVLNFDCPLYERNVFKTWRENMLAYFGDANSIVIEVQCGGPLQWTKNPPDPRGRAWR